MMMTIFILWLFWSVHCSCLAAVSCYLFFLHDVLFTIPVPYSFVPIPVPYLGIQTAEGSEDQALGSEDLLVPIPALEPTTPIKSPNSGSKTDSTPPWDEREPRPVSSRKQRP